MTHKIIMENSFGSSLTQYGDGLFETMLGVGNTIHHWDYHWQRLESSCQRLEITVPEHDRLYQQLKTELTEQANEYSVVKMIVSRGEGLRGYRSHAEQPCFVQFSISPYQFNPALYQGANVRLCRTRLSHQPLLAGMKHINRLEHVMARREVEDMQFDEGLLFNYENKLIEGLISNIFLIKDQQVLTPDLIGSGVTGTMRAYLLDFLPSIGYTPIIKILEMTDIYQADEVFLTNAISGIIPVTCIQTHKKPYRMTASKAISKKLEHPCSNYLNIS